MNSSSSNHNINVNPSLSSTNNSLITPSPSSSTTTTTTSSSSRPSSSSSTTQACAACKYQRRKCNPDCTLAPYFPADHQRQFLNAHRLFGVSNILKIIRGLDPHRRSEAMKSIIFQSNMRAHDPVGGCYRVILELERQYERDCHELALVLHQLALCRQAAALPPPNLVLGPDGGDVGDDNAAVYGNDQQLIIAASQQQQQQCYDYFYLNDNEEQMNNMNAAATMSGNSVNNNNVGGNEVEMEMFSLQQQQEEQGDDVKPLIDMFDVTHALAMGDEEEVGEITSKAADLDLAAGTYHCSTELQTKKEESNLMEQVPEHDLKGAASLFTLTSRDSSYV